MNRVTQAAAKELLDYNLETGVFTWKVKARKGPVAAGDVAGYTDLDGYIKIGIDGRYYNAHRLAFLYVTGQWPTGSVDHLDGNRRNNAWSNLRDVSQVVNMQNQRKAHADSKSGVMGASRTRTGRWKACITVDKQFFYLGLFDTAEQAGAAYMEAKRRLHPGCTI